MRTSRYLAAAAALAGLTVLAAPAGAQSVWQKAKQRAKEKLEQQIDKKTAETPTPTGAPAAPSGEGAPAKAAAASAAEPEAAEAAPAKVNSGADFTPGTRVLFATDFAKDELGDFPRKFELKGGNMEVAEVGSTRYLRSVSFGSFEIPLPEVLPEQFTMEFDLKPVSGWGQYVYFTDDEDRRNYLYFFADGAGIEGPNSYRVGSDVKIPNRERHIFKIQVMADGKYVKVYVDGVRVANAPNANVGRSNKIVIETKADQTHPVLVGNLRIAAGGKDLYKALEADGRVTAEGILFDTNSDRLRPESDAVLGQIGDMLSKHADLRLAIEGHTDNVGQAAANQTLSQKRADAVKAYLVAKHGVDAARLEAKGFGAGKQVAPNADEAGRQKNRRVELVKL
ncbi:OmpA family protein [Roseisolibacter sp. H3M3-2]|uniref:OmpA family protein n=1 Tax=Roseisolibacter sp. H3M3-2 TaxID=3031323 RepID=UPI0023DB0EF4|nr:OmpA family protein [Roseisolibacter sp. H3M3-2]MDF1502554.1 OmpA family protein [Roseisolibacter sp. H3M3-2]